MKRSPPTIATLHSSQEVITISSR